MEHVSCKITQILGNFHGFHLKKILSFQDNLIIFQHFMIEQNRNIYKELNRSGPVLHWRDPGFAFKKFSKITLIREVESCGNFGNTLVGVHKQTFNFKNLLRLNNLRRCFSGYVLHCLCKMIGSDGHSVGVLCNTQVSLVVLLHQLKEFFHQHVSFPFQRIFI